MRPKMARFNAGRRMRWKNEVIRSLPNKQGIGSQLYWHQPVAQQQTGLDLDVSPVLTRIPQGVRDFFARLRAPVDKPEGRANHGAMNSRLDIVEKDVADLKIGVRCIEQRLDDILPTLATKADLEKLGVGMEKMKSDMLKWPIAGWVTMFFSLASLQITLFNLARP
jgi:hypothetical protein